MEAREQECESEAGAPHSFLELRELRGRHRLLGIFALLGIASLATVAVLSSARLWEVKRAAESERRRADEVLRLSGLAELDGLAAEADRLWPADPAHLAAYAEWQRRANELGAELPEHERKLAELRALAEPAGARGVALAAGAPGPELRFADAREQWWHGELSLLVDGLKALFDPGSGLAAGGLSPEHGWSVPRRVAFAQTIAERSLSGTEASVRWAAALASIANPADCPPYHGLRLAPQLGLLPIGRDPDSGLWEFAHLQSGEPAERGSDGRLVLDEETGLVLVLLPGGSFPMGAQRTDPGAPNNDPQARSDESPVHVVSLAPFFLSKHEMTQGQWSRLTGTNPSHHAPSAPVGGRRTTLLHPVEGVSWAACLENCRRLGLSLPSEAQWEYAARAGTTSVWWSGDERASLLGVANLADQSARRIGADRQASQDWPELDDGFARHAPVNALAPNAFGLHGVHGNVWEWCLDGYAPDAYGRAAPSDPLSEPASSAQRVARGGAFDQAAVLARSATRFDLAPNATSDSIGLRPARVVAP